MRSVEITLDKPRHLRFTINALEQLEATLGDMPLRDVIGQLNRAGIRVTRQALWAGLRHEDRKLTPDRVGELMDAFFEAGGDLTDLYRAIDEAIMASGVFGSQKPEGNEENPPKEAATT